MQENRKKIIVIVGPTASGKTALSLSLAQKFNGEIISADSRQVYRGLDIGTEKITKEEMEGIPHHLIDRVEPSTPYTAAQFKADATQAIEDVTARSKIPIVAGGTVFYVETLLGSHSLPQVPPNTVLRHRLEKLPTETLFTQLKKQDPSRAQTIDKDNRRRLIRALEIVTALGSVPVPVKAETNFDAYIIGINTDRTELRSRIEVRLKQTLKKGLVEETRQILHSGVTKERLMEIGLEYRVVLEYLDGVIPEAKLEEVLVQKVWQYAKRQLTSLKRMKHVHWYSVGEKEKMLNDVQGFLD